MNTPPKNLSIKHYLILYICVITIACTWGVLVLASQSGCRSKSSVRAIDQIDQSLTNIENKIESISLDSFEIGAMLGYALHGRGGDRADMDRMIRARRDGNLDAIIQLFEEVEARNK